MPSWSSQRHKPGQLMLPRLLAWLQRESGWALCAKQPLPSLRVALWFVARGGVESYSLECLGTDIVQTLV